MATQVLIRAVTRKSCAVLRGSPLRRCTRPVSPLACLNPRDLLMRCKAYSSWRRTHWNACALQYRAVQATFDIASDAASRTSAAFASSSGLAPFDHADF